MFVLYTLFFPIPQIGRLFLFLSGKAYILRSKTEHMILFVDS